MKDLGQKLYNERRYDFTRVYIRQLMFKSTGDEILLQCKVIFNETSYEATLCVSYSQFNNLLMATGDAEFKCDISALIGEALTMDDHKKLQSSFQINLMKVFGRPMRVRSCTYHTGLVVLPMEELAENPDQAYVFLVHRVTFQPALR